MPWKKRGDTLYYYRSVRVGGRVRSEYQGHGPLAELLADCLEHDRTTRRKLRDADLRDLEDFREEQQALGFDDYFRQIEGIARAVMALAGFHLHKRSEWRRRRMPTSNTSQTLPAVAKPSTSGGEIAGRQAEPSSAFAEFINAPAEELNRRLELARQGDSPTLDWMKRAMLADPTGELVNLLAVGLPGRIEKLLVARAVGDDHVARVALLAQVERLSNELAGPTPSAMERVLADRVALSWLSLHVLELQFEREKHNFGPELTVAMERRIVRTNRQFNESVKTLAVVRRLALPAIRMFLAERQVNVTGAIRASGG